MNGQNWTPIGTSLNKSFDGVFDGDGHTISNLTIGGSNSYVGLFGYNKGTVKNVTLTDVNVTALAFVGGLVGRNDGGTVSGNTVVSTVSGSSDSYYVGGLVGYNRGGTAKNNKFYSNKDAVGYNYGGTVGTNTRLNLNKVTLPGGVTASGDTCFTVDGIAYAVGNITLAAKTGYVYSGTTSAKITADTDLSNLGTAILDTANHYVFGTSGNYTLATADNIAAAGYPKLIQVYALTLPGGVTVSGGIVVTVDGIAYAVGNITLAAKLGYVYSGTTSAEITADTDLSTFGTASLDTANHYVFGTSGNYTLATADNIAAAGYPELEQVYALTLQGVTVTGDSVVTIDGTTYAKDSVTVAAKTGYVYSGETTLNVAQDTTVSASLDTANHYVFGTSGNYTLATADNIAAAGYPELIQVYALTVPTGVTVSGSLLTDGNTAYVTTGNVTLSAADGYSLQNVTINGESLTDNFTFTVSADTTITADSVKFGNGGKSVEVGGTTGDFGSNNGVYSITASQQNSTLTGNNNNNAVILEGGGVNILTGGSGNDTFKFSAGGGIVTDYGIGSTKDSTGKTLSAPLGTDVIKVDGEVKGVYFDRAASSKKEATFTAVITYDSTAVEGDDTQIIVLQNINKKPTKYGSNPVYQTNDAAAATLKIWDTSGSSGKQAVISAAKLKKLFRDDDELSTDLLKQVADLGKLDGIGELNLPAVDALNQTAQATFNGGDNG